MPDPPKFWWCDVLDEAVERDPRLASIVGRFIPQNAGFWCPTGWYDLIIQLDEDIVGIDPDYTISQVKEKFGGLRYYTQEVSLDARALIRVAEEQSFSICQECGRPGILRKHGWYATLCGEHDRGDCDRGYFKESI